MIDCYVIQVMTGKEELFVRHLHRFKDLQSDMLVPKRELTIRKQGKHSKVTKPIFPGYVFWETDDPDPDTRWLLRSTPHFARFMKDRDGKMLPLQDQDRHLVSQLTVDGEVAGKSLITFDKNNRVKVLKGPLQGQEGSIIKVDRRKKRATVKIHLYDKTFKIDLEYEELKKTSGEKGSSAGAQPLDA